jgi:hypothetical protein
VKQKDEISQRERSIECWKNQSQMLELQNGRMDIDTLIEEGCGEPVE